MEPKGDHPWRVKNGGRSAGCQCALEEGGSWYELEGDSILLSFEERKVCQLSVM